MNLADLAILIFFVLLGSTTQRITGMGFGLIAAPFLVIVLGPGLGVQLTQILSGLASAFVLATMWRYAEVKTAAVLMVFAILGLIPGTWLIRNLDPAPLQVITGTLILIALLAILASERARVFKGPVGQASAGFISGFMNVTAAVGGPAIVLYSLSTSWKHEAFVATSQLYFLFLNAASLVAVGLPSLPLKVLLLALGTMLSGLLLGNVLARKVSVRLARRLVIGVALAGAVSTIIKGSLAL